ncbi:MAG: hypothetical protein K2X93_21285, partial [Candidatus Obscuribacterales bacterium]|nr:hypothetical protein [Candidatus Obscuribacterales bacterium]
MTRITRAATIATLVTRMDARPDVELPILADALVRLLMSGARSSGFWSGEMVAPAAGAAGSTQWRLIQRFDSKEQAVAWKESPQRAELLRELMSHTDGHLPGVSDELMDSGASEGSVATAIITEVKAETQEEYFAWECKIQTAQAQFPGYHGIYVEPPLPDRPGQWTTLLRFESPVAIENWFASPQRQTLVAEGRKFVKGTKFQQMTSSFPGWFPVDQLTGKGPPNWKSALLVMLGLYPIVMLEIFVLSPFEVTWNSALKTFINLTLSVAFTTWVSMPLFIKKFGWWLLPPDNAPPSIHVRGTLIVSAILLVEM